MDSRYNAPSHACLRFKYNRRVTCNYLKVRCAHSRMLECCLDFVLENPPFLSASLTLFISLDLVVFRCAVILLLVSTNDLVPYP